MKNGSLICEHSKNIPCGTYNNNVETPQLGLFWENVGTIFPIKGILLVNKELSIALETKTNFTEEEWLFFNIQGLRLNHCVKSQNNYFKPIQMLIVRFHYFYYIKYIEYYICPLQ